MHVSDLSTLSTMTVMQLRRLQGAVSEELSFRAGEGAKRFQRAIATERTPVKHYHFEIDFSDRWRAPCVALLAAIAVGALLVAVLP